MKRLRLSKTERKFLGVCGGLGIYSDTDPTIWRLVFIIATVFSPIFILAYFLFALVM